MTKSKTPTREEIAKEIETLKDLAPKIPQHDAFGSSNRAKVDAEIDALMGRFVFSDDEDDDEGDEYDAELESVAMAARDWAEGRSDEKPSDNWKPLVGVAVKPISPLGSWRPKV